MESLLPLVEERPQLLVACLATGLLILLPLIYLLFLRGRVRRNAVLLCGICDSGKTTLFSQLVHAKSLPTVTSLQPNQSDLTAGKRRFKLVDLPGHERLRRQYLDKFKATAKALVYVVDANTIAKELKDCAECLYSLLTEPELLAGGRIRVLVLCNKQDQSMAKTEAYVRSALEREMETLRATRAGALAGTSGGTGERTLGREGKPFEFKDAGCQVEFASCSALSDVTCVRQWLGKL